MSAARVSRFGRLGLSCLLPCLLTGSVLSGANAGTPPGDLTLELVTGGFNRPVAVVHAGDHTGRLFIVEQRGVIRIYDVPSGMLLPTPFLDIQSLVDDGGNEQGLLALAFHPDFRRNGLFFVDYTRDPGPGLDRTVIQRYRVSKTNPNVADPTSAQTLFEIEQDFSNHNGGDLHFGPDGYLYITLGDGGSGGDPNDRAQDKTQLLGKMLRIDVDGTPGSSPNLCGLNPTSYGIPPSNPFAADDGQCDEIWAYGLRNVWRFSFDRLSGNMFIADVGQNAIEEVDFQPASSAGGENYGWPCMEGNNMPNFGPCDGAPLIPPIFTYTHALGFSITGGYMYRGPIGSLRGNYIVGDYGTGRIWFGDNTLGWNFTQWQDTSFTISSFGEDQIGNVYMANFGNNSIYRFALPAGTGAGRVPDGAGPTAPLRVDEAGGGDLTLTWDPSCNGGDSDYEVYEGDLGDFESHRPKVCSTGGLETATITPKTGDRYFLVVPRNATREGSYGTNSWGLERPAGSAVCLDQALRPCP